MVKIPDHLCSRSPVERNLVVAELKRVAEFARMSTGSAQAYSVLKPYLEKYDIEHHFV